MARPMGELKQRCLRVDFDRRLKLEFHGSKVTTDAVCWPTESLMTALNLLRRLAMFLPTVVPARTGGMAWSASFASPFLAVLVATTT